MHLDEASTLTRKPSSIAPMAKNTVTVLVKDLGKAFRRLEVAVSNLGLARTGMAGQLANGASKHLPSASSATDGFVPYGVDK
eukprot:2962190-Amphidinium_carterae.1